MTDALLASGAPPNTPPPSGAVTAAPDQPRRPPRTPAAEWAARLAELDTDIALLGQAVNRLTGRHAFNARCALEEAHHERAMVRREIEAIQGGTP